MVASARPLTESLTAVTPALTIGSYAGDGLAETMRRTASLGQY